MFLSNGFAILRRSETELVIGGIEGISRTQPVVAARRRRRRRGIPGLRPARPPEAGDQLPLRRERRAQALLLKLDSTGAIQWQNAYNGGAYCFFNGYSESCADIGAVIYSLHQAPDGGHLLAGDGNLKLTDEVPIEPWLAKVDASGNLLWQHLYYQVNPATGRPLGEYFASSALATDAGPMAIGYTENYTLQKGELYGVKTDGSGAVGTSCSEVNPASPLTAVNPALTAIAPSLPVQTTLTTTSKSPATTLATSVVARANC